MKSNLILCMAIILIASCQEKPSSPKNTDLIQSNLKGPVEQTTETPYKVDSTGNIGAMDSCCAEISLFNDSGYVTTYTRKDSKGDIKNQQTISHYPNGAVHEVVITKDGKPDSRVTIETDDKGNYSTAKSYDSTGKEDNYYTDLKQNDYGEITGGKQFNIDSTLKYSFESVYDDSARFVSGHTDSAGKTIYSSSVTLNDKGDPVKRINTHVEKDSTTHDTITFRYDQYDDHGNWTQRTTLNADGKPTKVTKREITYFKKEG